MKKSFITVLMLTSVVVLSACSTNQEATENTTEQREKEVDESETADHPSPTNEQDNDKSEESEEIESLKEELNDLKKEKDAEEIEQLKQEINELKNRQNKSKSNSNKITKEPRLIENENGGTDFAWPHELTDISNLTLGENMDEEMATDACSLVNYYNESLVALYNGDITAITFFVGDSLYEHTLLPNYYSGEFKDQTASVECLRADYFPEVEQIHVIADRTFSHVSGSGTVTIEYIIDADTMEVIDFNEIEVR